MSFLKKAMPPKQAIDRVYLPRLVFYPLLALFTSLFFSNQAMAIPPFARQTGMECSACHTVYPQLNNVGRQFKLNGYTTGDTSLIGQFGAWAQGSFSRTKADQTDNAAPDFGKNDNFALDQASLFYGGRITEKVGAFAQATYDGIEKIFVWDNVDIRFSDQKDFGNNQLTYGISINNSPTVQDIWNTTPTWGFPFDGSGLAPTPAAGTLIEGGLGQISMGGTVYGMLNDSFYAEAGFYHTLSRGTINALNNSADGAPKSSGLAPYWRFFWQMQTGPHLLAIGTFGLHASLYPDANKSAGSDKYTDIGIDSQYQYIGDRDSVTARTSLILEFQTLDASVILGNSDNRSNHLYTSNSSISYTYDHILGFTTGMTYIWGDNNSALYGTQTGSPNSTAFTFQLDWLPLDLIPWETYLWFNPKLTVQYVVYTKFDGSKYNIDGNGRKASDNNTLFLLTTLTF